MSSYLPISVFLIVFIIYLIPLIKYTVNILVYLINANTNVHSMYRGMYSQFMCHIKHSLTCDTYIFSYATGLSYIPNIAIPTYTITF